MTVRPVRFQRTVTLPPIPFQAATETTAEEAPPPVPSAFPSGETVHWLWVVGAAGAVSISFLPDAKLILGRTLATFPSAHSPRPLPDFEPHGPCEFLEAECWVWHGSSLGLEPLLVAYEADDYDAIWCWLTGLYDRLLVTLTLADREG